MNKTATRFLAISLAVSFILSACDAVGIGTARTQLVVDINAVAKALGRDAQMQKQLEEAHAVLNAQLLQITTDLTENLEKEKAGTDDREQIEKLNTAVDVEIARTQQLARSKADNYRTMLVKDFIKEVREQTATIAKSRNAAVVTMLTPQTIWFDTESDITDEVIAALRARDNTIEKPVAESDVQSGAESNTSE